jgi:L-ascorbate metabolism protein UlaG (beta-lactamase superfamily)
MQPAFVRRAPFEGSSMRLSPLLPGFALVLALGAFAPPAPAQAPAAVPTTADNYTLTLPPGPPPAGENGEGTIQFIGTATVLIHYQGLTILTDPNFLHRGEQVHLGYGLTSERLTEPAFALDALPPIDLVILSHLHEDHFDRLVQEKLRHDVPIVTTRESAERLEQLGFTQRYGLSRWDSLTVTKGDARLRVTAMPARHGGPAMAVLLPTVMGSMLDFQEGPAGAAYRIYISGDTLVYDDIAQIPLRFPDVDLALLHLGGMRLFGMVKASMDGNDGVQMLRTIAPQRAIPLHYNDYGVYQSPLADFERAVREAGMQDKVIFLGRGDTYGFARARH